MGLEQAIDFFVNQAHSLACMQVICGDRTTSHRAKGGIMNLQGETLREDALFDLASLTKLFTGMLILRLSEEGMLDLRAPVTAYAPQFVHLSSVTVDEVLGFEKALITDQRVDAQTTREAGLQELFGIHPSPNGDARAYSDMHAMVLRYVVEGAGGASYQEMLRSRILSPLGMHSTFGWVPDRERARCVSCDREHRIEGAKWILRDGIAPGVPHDPKARLLTTPTEVCGHAGYFASAEDLETFCRGVLNFQVLSPASLRFMAINRTGRPLPLGGYTQYLGCQCYVRHPQQVHSEVPVYMSDETVAVSGFTGHHVSVDPKNGLFVIALGNRILNRLSVLVPEKGRTLEDYGLNRDGTGQIVWPGSGERIWSSTGYVHLKDEHLHRVIASVI